MFMLFSSVHSKSCLFHLLVGVENCTELFSFSVEGVQIDESALRMCDIVRV